MSGNELEGLTLIEICVTFLCAQSRREKRGRGERERKKRDCKIERASGVKFLQTIPAFPTRLIKL